MTGPLTDDLQEYLDAAVARAVNTEKVNAARDLDRERKQHAALVANLRAELRAEQDERVKVVARMNVAANEAAKPVRGRRQATQRLERIAELLNGESDE